MSQVTSKDIFKNIEGYEAYQSFSIPVPGQDGKARHIEIVLVELNPKKPPSFSLQLNVDETKTYLSQENIIDLAKKIEDVDSKNPTAGIATEVALVIPTNEDGFPPLEGSGYGVDYDLHRKLIVTGKEDTFQASVKEKLKAALASEKICALSKSDADFDISHHTIWAVGPKPPTERLPPQDILKKAAETKALYGKVFKAAVGTKVTDLIIPAVAGGNFLLKDRAIPVLFDGVKDFLYGEDHGQIQRIYLPFLGNDHDNAFDKRSIYTLNALTVIGA